MVEYMNNGSSGFQQFMASRNAQKKPGPGSMVLWGIIAILAGWLTYSWLSPNAGTRNQEPGTSAALPAQVDVAAPAMPAQVLMGNAVTARIAGLRISDIELKGYAADDATNIILLASPHEFLEVGFSGAGTAMPGTDTLWRINRAMGGPRLYMYWKSPTGVEFRRSVAMSADYVITITDTVANDSETPIVVGQYARIVRAQGEAPRFAVETGGIARANGDIRRERWKRLARSPMAFSTGAGFVGFTDQYWQTVAGISAEESFGQNLRIRARPDGMFQADSALEVISIAPGATHVWSAAMFAGPKNQSDLRDAAAFLPGIDQTIDYGWFWFLARPFLWAINSLHDMVGNYGVAIILFTILLRMLMWPLTKKSFTAMCNMQKMQPEMQRIQKLYADDKKRMQQEMMNMYKQCGTNPMGGCLPMLVQIPIFFALYKALLISVPMRNADFLWISDLAARDPVFILPIIMGATMWLQQRLQMASQAPAAAGDPAAQMQKAMKYMPVIFTVMFAFMPAGLVLYWTVSNMFGIGQMWWIRRK
jgi:YidC/Oxa1 family membrane protein insertase